MPKVKRGESKQEYISRALPVIMKEHPEKNVHQAAGQAKGMYESPKWNPNLKRRR